MRRSRHQIHISMGYLRADLINTSAMGPDRELCRGRPQSITQVGTGQCGNQNPSEGSPQSGPSGSGTGTS